MSMISGNDVRPSVQRNNTPDSARQSHAALSQFRNGGTPVEQKDDSVFR